MHEIEQALSGYERVVHINEDGEFLGKVEYRRQCDDRLPSEGQLPTTLVVHEPVPTVPRRRTRARRAVATRA